MVSDWKRDTYSSVIWVGVCLFVCALLACLVG